MKPEIQKKAINPEELKQEVNPAGEILYLRSEVRKLAAIINEMKEGEGELETLFKDFEEAIPIASIVPPFYKPPAEKKSVTSPCLAVTQLNDWHYGAVQKKEEIEGFGFFSPDEAERRLLKQLNLRLKMQLYILIS